MSVLTTKLSAVNGMLRLIGNSPIDTLIEVEDNIEAFDALTVLEETNREVQSESWSFNTFYDYELVPSAIDKRIYLPENTVRFRSANEGNVYVDKNKIVYDLTNNTDEFEGNISVELTVVEDFETIVESARKYIYIRAARKFQIEELGSETLAKFTVREEELALMILREEESQIKRFNYLNSSESQSILNR